MDPMPGEMTYLISDDVLTAQLEGEAVLLDLETKSYYRLNATAARIWKGVEDRLEPSQIVDVLIAEFAVARGTAQAETERTLRDLRACGLLK
jgi:hypothetical protein